MLAGPDGCVLMEQGNAEVLEAGQKDIELIGPVEEIEAEVVEAHKGFWNK